MKYVLLVGHRTAATCVQDTGTKAEMEQTAAEIRPYLSDEFSLFIRPLPTVARSWPDALARWKKIQAKLED